MGPFNGSRAQEGDEPVAVLDRSRGIYDAKGIDLGGFRLFPQFFVAESYDDNVFADDNKTKDDLITTVAAALVARSEWSRHELEMVTQVRNQIFVDNTDEDRTEYFIQPRLRLDLIERNQLDIVAEHSRQTIGRDDSEDTEGDDPTEFNRFFSNLRYTHRFNRLSVAIDSAVTRDDYIASRDDEDDRTEYRFSLPFGYELSPLTDLKFDPFYRVRDFDTVDRSGADRDAQAFGATVGFDTEVSRIFHVGLDVGFVANTFDDSQFDNEVNLITEGDATWYVTALTTVKGRVSRRDIATNQIGSSSKTQTTVEGEVQHELQKNVLLLFEAQFLQDDFRDIDRLDNRATIGLSGEYLINRRFSMAADYQYEQRWSDEKNRDFTRNLVTLGLRTKF